jgi:hypothetical protein
MTDDFEAALMELVDTDKPDYYYDDYYDDYYDEEDEEQWVADNEQPHDEQWELAVSVVRAIHLQGVDIQAIVDVIKNAERQQEEITCSVKN